MTAGCGWSTPLARTLISVTPEGRPEIACALNGAPAGLGFLPGGEALVTDMHGRSLVRCARRGSP